MQWPFRDASAREPEPARGSSTPPAPWWLYACIAVFLVLALWIYVANTRAIRDMALTKERLRTRVQAVCGLLQATATGTGDRAALAAVVEQLETTERENGNLDEYLFIFDQEGSMWLNGGQPQLCRSAAGTRPRPSLTAAGAGGQGGDSANSSAVQQLLRQARQGGGFASYAWRHPRTQETRPKTSYVQEAPAAGLVVGCGTYA